MPHSRSPLLTDDEPAAYLIRRVIDSEREAAQADQTARELDAIQRHRHQKKARTASPQQYYMANRAGVIRPLGASDDPAGDR